MACMSRIVNEAPTTSPSCSTMRSCHGCVPGRRTVVAAQSEDPRGQWRATKDAASRAIVDGGGTITHHHAVGSDHLPYLADEIGDVGVAILRGIKTAIDPAGIMNPGTLVP